jgi:hypothetical protein
MNKCGQKIHSWHTQYTPGLSVYLQPNGHLLKCGTYLFVIGRDNDNIKEAIKVELRISCSIQSPVSPKADVRLSPVNISVSKYHSSSKYLFELVWYASITKAISESKKNY